MLGNIHSRLTRNYDSAYYFYQKELSLAQQQGDNLNKANVFSHLGTLFYFQNEYVLAIENYLKAAQLFKKENSNLDYVDMMGSVGTVYSRQGNHTKALEYFQRALKVGERIFTNSQRNHWELNLALTYKKLGKIEEAIETFWKLARFYEKQQDKSNLANCYYYLASTYESIQEYEYAEEFLQKVKAVWDELNEKDKVITSLRALGSNALLQDKNEKAYVYYREALEESVQLKDTLQITFSNDVLGGYWLKLKKNKEAESYLLPAYEVYKAKDMSSSRASNALDLTLVYLGLQKYELAKKYMLVGQQIAQETASQDLLIRSQEVALAYYAHTGQVAEILSTFDNYRAFQDTTQKESLDLKILDLREQYETEKKEAAITQLEEEASIREELLQQRKITNYALGGIAFIFAVFMVSAIYSYRKQKKVKERISLLMDELNHRVKNNLQVLSSIFSLQQSQLADQKAKAVLSENEQRVNAMTLLHKQLYEGQHHSEIELQSYLKPMIENLMAGFGYSNETFALRFEVQDITLDVDKAVSLGLIINELACNAFKYAYRNIDVDDIPSLQIMAVQDNGKVLVHVWDNGVGLPEGFELKKSTSFGLRLTWSLSKQIQAKVDTYNENGAHFEISFEV